EDAEKDPAKKKDLTKARTEAEKAAQDKEKARKVEEDAYGKADAAANTELVALAKLDGEFKNLRRGDANVLSYFDVVTDWTDQQAYQADAFRLLTNKQLCLTCHQVGNIRPTDFKGPRLDHVGERLRPEWVARWVANPQRFLTYNTIMPQNFKPGIRENQDDFPGSSLKQVEAVRDAVMVYPRGADLLINRRRLMPAGGGK